MADLLVFPQETVLRAIDPAEAIERVRDGFVEYAGNEWQMPPKVYLDASPNGDFRAMPAKGAGLAILKWVTSFPRNAEAGLPVVMGMVCVSSVANGEPLALVDVRSVTALRTGAVAAVAAQELAREDARSVGMIGCGLHGTWAARCLAEAEYAPGICFDPDPEAAGKLAGELGWAVGTREEALACDIVTCVTPGHEPVIFESDLRPGLHLNMLGADAPGKAEAEPAAVATLPALLRRLGPGEPRRRAHRRRGGRARDPRAGDRARCRAHRFPIGALRTEWGYAVRLHRLGDPGPRTLPRADRSAPGGACACRDGQALTTDPRTQCANCFSPSPCCP